MIPEKKNVADKASIFVVHLRDLEMAKVVALVLLFVVEPSKASVSCAIVMKYGGLHTQEGKKE